MPSYKDNKTGKWYSKFYYSDYYGDSKQKFKRGFKTKKEADIFERDFLKSQQYQPTMLFKDFLEVYKKDKYQQLKLSSRQSKNYRFKVILPYFENIPINEIDKLQVKKFQNKQLKLNKTTKYINTLVSEINAVLNHAVNYYGLDKNKLKGIEKAKNPNEIKKPMRFWTFDEFNQVIKLIDDEKAKLAINILYFSGMRKGEMFALTYDDIDYKNNIISISKTYNRINGNGVVTPTKTYENRKILMPKFIIDDIKKYRDGAYDKHGFIIEWGKNFMEQSIKTACKELKNIRPIHIHGLRHSNASYLISKGANVVLISKRLGHKDVSITLNTYSHFYPDDQLNLIKSIEKDIQNIN